GGRSQNSNIATIYSKGKTSRRLHEYSDEHAGQEMFPFHEPKFFTMSNVMASIASLAKALIPEHFAKFGVDRGILAQKIIEDMYVIGSVPWLDDPKFIAQVDAFLQTLPPDMALRMLAYRTLIRQQQRAAMGRSEAHPIRNASDAKQPFWLSGGTLYIDLTPFGVADIADAARTFPLVLSSVNVRSPSFANAMRQQNMFQDILAQPEEWQPIHNPTLPTELVASATQTQPGLLKSHII
ncbi:MAG: hypothetical protein JO128_06490, partial [Alphaproteobacteria bacterium]|nr:hypothetical protein [Alphaproteobacteria bacterium]